MSLKQKLAKGFCKSLSSIPIINSTLFTLSNMYIDEYRDFSYDEEVNGERDVIIKLSKLQTTSPVFFDVGANVGDWTRHADTLFIDYKAHLFELSSSTFQILQENFKNNAKVISNNVALSDKAGTIEYIDFGQSDGGNTMLLNASYHRKQSKIVSAKAIKGDDYCAENNISHIHFLKIDTEGAEYFVLKGFESMLQRKEIDIIQFEYGYTHADAKTLMKDFFEFFESHGYVVGRLTKEGVTFKSFSYTDNDFKSGPNYIACLPQFQTILQSF